MHGSRQRSTNSFAIAIHSSAASGTWFCMSLILHDTECHFLHRLILIISCFCSFSSCPEKAGVDSSILSIGTTNRRSQAAVYQFRRNGKLGRFLFRSLYSAYCCPGGGRAKEKGDMRECDCIRFRTGAGTGTRIHEVGSSGGCRLNCRTVSPTTGERERRPHNHPERWRLT
jgi:hypothetical protein